MNVTRTVTTPLVVGQFVTGTSTLTNKAGKVRTGTWNGTYEGVKASQHAGEPMHVFRDGDINGTAQATHAIPVDSLTVSVAR